MENGDERTGDDSRQGHPCGYVYIARNEFHDGDLLKIGKTKRHPNERASELGSNTGVLGKFKILHSVYVDNCDEAEREVHKRLETYRVKANREFFKIPFKDAVSVVHETCLKFIITSPLERPGPWHIIQSNRDDARAQLNEAYETLRIKWEIYWQLT
ncbi:MAG TPA: GIY-YIG nuclease family protein [Gammaproteobacteria bacterium]|nr:GIY-YIG nuclease family protein [Gammaproteobacteria bacterium]